MNVPLSVVEPAGATEPAGHTEPAGRTPDRLLRPERLAQIPPTRLSASRALVNRMTAQGWRVERLEFAIDEEARGRARYRVRTPSGPSTSSPSPSDRAWRDVPAGSSAPTGT